MTAPGLAGVLFTRNNAPYLAGETAWFLPVQCAKFVSSGVATYVEPPAGLDKYGKRLIDEDTKEATAPKPKKAAAKPKGSKP